MTHNWKEAILAGYNLNLIVYDSESYCGQLSFRLVELLKEHIKACHKNYKLDRIYVSEKAKFGLEEYLLPMPRTKLKTKFLGKLETFETLEELGEYSDLNKYFTEELRAILPAGDIEIGIAMLVLKTPTDNEPLYKPLIISF